MSPRPSHERDMRTEARGTVESDRSGPQLFAQVGNEVKQAIRGWRTARPEHAVVRPEGKPVNSQIEFWHLYRAAGREYVRQALRCDFAEKGQRQMN